MNDNIDMKRLMEASYVGVTVPNKKVKPKGHHPHCECDGCLDARGNFPFDNRLMDIALDCGDFVWVHASYADDLPDGAVQVGDARSPGYSHDGNRIVSIPSAWCTFYTDEEAADIERMRDADERMLSYAR